MLVQEIDYRDIKLRAGKLFLRFKRISDAHNYVPMLVFEFTGDRSSQLRVVLY
ncbi:hypothetical protein [Alloactinosynnema sp. L-07]|nr:hypothetical protein [Alloactinosynnema sp. L-07]